MSRIASRIRGARRCLAAVLSLSFLALAPMQMCLPAAVARNIPAPPPMQSKEPVVRMELRPDAPAASDVTAPPADVKPLDADKLQQLIKRLPAMTVEPSKNTAARVSGEAVVKPELGVKVEPSFPPSGQAPIKPAVATESLRVVRINAEGTFHALSELSISFSQPMVALSDLSTVNDVANIPVKLTPQPEGKWRWVDSQTLIFKPSGGGFPKSTTYKGTVPVGTASINGVKLEQPRSFEFTLPTPSIETFVPQSQVGDLQPTILALFDQKIDPAAVRKHLRATVSGANQKGEIELQLVSQQQVIADQTLNGYVANVDAARWLALKPSQPLPLASTIKVVLTAGCPSKEGLLTTTKEQKFSFSTFGPLKITERPARGLSPYAYHYVDFSNELDAQKFTSSMVHISPPVPDFSSRVQGNVISFGGGFKARTNYKITFSANISDVYGQKLDKAAVADLNTGDIDPSLTGLDSQMKVIPFGKSATIRFTAQGAPKIEVEILAVTPKDWHTFAAFNTDNDDDSEADRIRALPPPPVSVPPQLPGAPQPPSALEPPPPQAPPRPAGHVRPTRHAALKAEPKLPFKRLALKEIAVGQTTKDFEINLQHYLNHGLGHLVVLARTVGTKPDQSVKLRSWVQVTKIGLDAYQSKDLVAVASSLSQGSPMAGVQMQLLPQGSKAVTDRAGIARLKLDDAKHSQWLVATNAQDSDSAILSESDNATEEMGWARLTADPFYQWSLFTDRGLYRPGETVQIKGWARKLRFGKDEELLFSGVPDAKANYAVTGSDGSQIGKGSFPIDNHGGFSFAIKIPDKVNLGSASLSVDAAHPVLHAGGKDQPSIADEGNSVSFDIQEFRRPEFQFTLSSATGTSTIFDQPANVTAEARYYATGALRNSPVKWEVSAQTTSYSPPNWTEYSFGGRTLESLARTDMESVQKNLQTTTDAGGRSAVRLSFPFLAAPLPVSCVCQATVQDIDRHNWSDRLTLLVHPAQVYVGIKTEDNYGEHQLPDPLKTKVIVTDLDGHAVANKTVHLRLVGHSDDNNEFKTVEERDVQSGVDPVDVSLPVKTEGSYQIVALVADDNGRRNQTAVDATVSLPLVIETSNDLQNITVDTDKKTYQPGEGAKILIHAPFAPAHGIVTVHKQCIIQTIPIDMDKLTKTITVPITAAFYPNINVDVNLAGKDSMMAYGSAVVSVPPLERKLDVKVEPAKQKFLLELIRL